MSLDVIMRPIGTVPSSRGTKDAYACLSCSELLCLLVPCSNGHCWAAGLPSRVVRMDGKAVVSWVELSELGRSGFGVLSFL